MQVETVKIQTPNGDVVINKSDFDPAKHALAGQEPVVEEPVVEEPVKRTRKTATK